MARILGNTFFMEARLSTRKKDSSQPSMIAMLVNSGSMSLEKKKTRGRRPMNGNASTVEPPGKKASNEVKAGKASF